jgi:hypothetical protein
MARAPLPKAVLIVSILLAGGVVSACGSSGTSGAGNGASSGSSAGPSAAPGPRAPAGDPATQAAAAPGKHQHRLHTALADGRPRHRRPSRSSPFHVR